MTPIMNPLDEHQRRGAECLSDLVLDRLRLEQLDDAAKRERVSAHLAGCDRCRSRLAAIGAVVAPPFDFGEVDVGQPPATSLGWRRRALWLAPALAVAAAMAVLVPWKSSGERSKGGGWQLGLVVQHPSGRVAPVFQGQALAPGDRLRFEVSAPTDAFVSVISLDAKSAVTPFVPATGTTVAVRAGKRQLLEGAVRLDDAIGPERLMLLACARSIPVGEVVAAARTALEQAQGHPEKVDTLALPCTPTSFWIRKEVRP
jgi:hypothetical protein